LLLLLLLLGVEARQRPLPPQLRLAARTSPRFCLPPLLLVREQDLLQAVCRNPAGPREFQVHEKLDPPVLAGLAQGELVRGAGSVPTSRKSQVEADAILAVHRELDGVGRELEVGHQQISRQCAAGRVRQLGTSL
jgi:hypothetical protein